MPDTILVTGANSFIGGWIIKYLLDKGYNVRGTVRSQAKEARVLDGIPKDQQCQISFVHINDVTTDSFDEAVQDVDGIIHVASPVHLTVTDPEKEFLLPAINGTMGVLQAAHKYNQNHPTKIKRIVITSSFAAVFDPSKGIQSDYTYTEKDWCSLTYTDGVAAKNDRVTAYRVSKTCAEHAAWEFLDKEKPSFTIATIFSNHDTKCICRVEGALLAEVTTSIESFVEGILKQLIKYLLSRGEHHRVESHIETLLFS
ncbi:unnamed protein product [Rotaria sp. Silwood1]|nr:unnamed protein product [Rotaria sp. Silwood1]CAF1557559.1 unnamed protein product [Rotaria sp. Silwood1]CAF3636972.1 unnamed protein product [Rotaria sp. Silwood1]CAF3640064.1 unnamed protein product [Rotaria sp. Silwood1]CAF4701132.1 unnamed protein product [Rotaria sp. Silwood1]